MVWFKVDDSLESHSKPRQAQLEAIGLWTVCGSWSAKHLQDGRVAEWYVETWPKGRAAAARLVRAGLWHAPGHDCPDCPQIEAGWIFHQFDERNPLAEQVLADRKAATERQRRAREAAKSRRSNAVRHAVTDTVTHDEVTAAVTPESHRESRSPRPDPKGGSEQLEGDRYGSDARERDEPPTDEPPIARCAEHRHTLNPPPCGACARAREAVEAAEAERQRQADEAAVAERRRMAELRAEEIARCALCDADGRREGGAVCTHDPEQLARNDRGREAVRAMLAKRQRNAS